MVMNKFEKFSILVISVFLLSMVGCSQRTGEVECSPMNLSPEFLYGTWYLEEVTLTSHIVGLEPSEYVYALPVDVSEFVGYHIEFNSEFVKLRDRTFDHPEYSMDISQEGWIFFSNMHIWEAGSFESPQDLINEFRAQEMCAGYEFEGNAYPRFVTIFIQYPDPAYWQGLHIDLELLESEDGMLMEFNPLLQGGIVLNDDYILLGSNVLILARRVE